MMGRTAHSKFVGQSDGEHFLELGAGARHRRNGRGDTIHHFRARGLLLEDHIVVVDEVGADGGPEELIDLEFEQSGPVDIDVARLVEVVGCLLYTSPSPRDS